MDNFKIDITTDNIEILDYIVKIAMSEIKEITGYAIDNKSNELILYWGNYDNPNYCKFPVKMKSNDIVNFVKSFIINSEIPDIDCAFDGDIGKAYTIYNNAARFNPLETNNYKELFRVGIVTAFFGK